ncbi:hypothetical protein NQ560_00955 [Dorea formicigenerans]|uniref:Uncharacterized protein n=1 Tax=Dorea formicigenerans ATCC 27755 TaxID=411461 RepID=B0G4E4_9FIRM|nr:hypothetical protein [Dorea formicigenerans]EDR47596.1 hypothetical protein DORFOR_01131 [Dorea formicigenerans ATCC 27755]UWP20048.1 hypothetical protein NQ560_00955 [Dorea formicigenerans]
MTKAKEIQFEKMKEDAMDFGEILAMIPEEKQGDARNILKGFALCASIEEDKSA